MWFCYNWEVRDEWFDWCGKLPTAVLLRPRVGGTSSILYTFFHIVDVEYSWIRALQGKPDFEPLFDDYKTLDKLKHLFDSTRHDIEGFLNAWTADLEDETVSASWIRGQFTKGEVLRHVIAHEIHHMGQLSIWARELGLQSISASLIGRGYSKSH